MALSQEQNTSPSGEIERASDCPDLSEIVCLLWDYLVAEPCYSLVSVSDGYVKRLMHTDYSMTTDEIKRDIAYHRQALHSISDCESPNEWWEHLGEIAALEEHLIAVIEESVCATMGQLQSKRSYDMLDRLLLLLAKSRYQKAQTVSELNSTPATTIALIQGLIDACLQVLSLPNEPALEPIKDALFSEVAVTQELVDAYSHILNFPTESVTEPFDLPQFEIPFPWE